MVFVIDGLKSGVMAINLYPFHLMLLCTAISSGRDIRVCFRVFFASMNVECCFMISGPFVPETPVSSNIAN